MLRIRISGSKFYWEHHKELLKAKQQSAKTVITTEVQLDCFTSNSKGRILENWPIQTIIKALAIHVASASPHANRASNTREVREPHHL